MVQKNIVNNFLYMGRTEFASVRFTYSSHDLLQKKCSTVWYSYIEYINGLQGGREVMHSRDGLLLTRVS